MEGDTQIRCVNIDWLEVYCLEPVQPRDASYFEQMGYGVRVRSYGTPNYREMFTLIDEGHRFIEVRRVPVSLRKDGGIFVDGSCHIRLSNRSCYLRNPVQVMAEFILAHGYTYKSVSRIDICLDFQLFDNGWVPQFFVDGFMRGEYQKINQCNIAAHGKDGWHERAWGSLKWGAPTSAVTTKLYNKTKELAEVADKPYIREVWQAVGFAAGVDVWRVEFAIKSQSNALLSSEEQTIITRSLDAYSGKDRQFFQFCVYANKYFHFKQREYTRTGQLKQKNRCADVPLFSFSGREKFYTPTRLVWQPEAGRTEKLLAKRLFDMARDKSLSPVLRRAAETLEIHLCQRYDVLDYSKQLIEAIEWYYSGADNLKATFDELQDIQRRYQLSDVHPGNLARKLNYLIY